MALIKIEHHHYGRRDGGADPNLIDNERTKLTATLLMSLSCALATAFAVAAAAGITTLFLQNPAMITSSPEVLIWIALAFAALAAVLFFVARFTLGGLKT